MKIRKSRTARVLLAGLLVATGHTAFAVSITGVTITNNSTAEEATDTRGRLREFHTAYSIGPAVTGADSIELTTQMQWYNGYKATGGLAQVHKRNVVYDISFTVLDPTNSGYTLSVDSVMRGYTTAIWSGYTGAGAGDNPKAITATGTTLSGRFDADLDDAIDDLGTQLADLTILGSTGNTFAGNLDTETHGAQDASRSFAAGNFTGTRTFGLRFTSVPSPSTNVFAQNDHLGEGSVRYGLLNTLTGFDINNGPQPGDLPNDDLGHLVTLRLSDLTFDAPPLPVPAPLWLLLGGGLLGWRMRKH